MDKKIKLLQEELYYLTMSISEEDFDVKRAEEILEELDKSAPLSGILALEKEEFRKKLNKRLGRDRK